MQPRSIAVHASDAINCVPIASRRAVGRDDDVGDVGLIAVGIGDEPQPGVPDDAPTADASRATT